MEIAKKSTACMLSVFLCVCPLRMSVQMQMGRMIRNQAAEGLVAAARVLTTMRIELSPKVQQTTEPTGILVGLGGSRQWLN